MAARKRALTRRVAPPHYRIPGTVSGYLPPEPGPLKTPTSGGTSNLFYSPRRPASIPPIHFARNPRDPRTAILVEPSLLTHEQLIPTLYARVGECH